MVEWNPKAIEHVRQKSVRKFPSRVFFLQRILIPRGARDNESVATRPRLFSSNLDPVSHLQRTVTEYILV